MDAHGGRFQEYPPDAELTAPPIVMMKQLERHLTDNGHTLVEPLVSGQWHAEYKRHAELYGGWVKMPGKSAGSPCAVLRRRNPASGSISDRTLGEKVCECGFMLS